MPLDQRLMKDFLGGDPIAGSKATRELLDQGDVAENELFSRPLDYGKTYQVRRRWLRYVAAREHSVAPRLLDRLKGKNEFRDKFSAAFLCAGISKSDSVSGGLYTAIKAEIDNVRPGDADAVVMAYGYAGADLASIFNLINENSYAWEKLSTFAFRSACVSCARINTGNSWVLERLITHRWDRDGFELEKVPNLPDAPIHRIAIDDSEIAGESTHTFMTWRRGDVADQMSRDWSGHAHWRVRWFGAQILSSLGFVRTVNPIIQWLRTEQVPRIRGALLHALERSDSTAGADALLDTLETMAGEGTQAFAKVGWRASDKGRALKALTAISNADSIAGAEALVSLARLGYRHPELVKFLDSHDHYRRLNAMLALGYLGDEEDARRLTQMRAEAAAWLERIYISASIALLGVRGAAAQLHRDLVAAAEDPDFDKRVDVFFLHRYLQNAVLGGLEAGGAESRELLDFWRNEIEPLEPLPTAAQSFPEGTEHADTASAAVTASARTDSAPASSRPAVSEAISNMGESKPGQAEPEKNETAAGDGNGGAGNESTGPEKEDKDKGLLQALGRIGGIGGIGGGILLILYRTLVFPKLGATQANLFMILIYGAVFAMLALWAYQLTKKVALSLLLLLFGVVLGILGRSTLRSEGETPRDSVQTTAPEQKKNGELQVRGIVEDSRGNSIPNALVSVLGYGKDAVFSDASGNFELPAHAQAGETVPLHAEKPGFTPANLPAFKVGSGAATLTLGDPDTSSPAPGAKGAGSQASVSSTSPIRGGSDRDAARRSGDKTGSTPNGISPQAPKSASGHCESLQEFQGDESALATLAERAFSRQSYDCTVAYLEQARKVQSSGVWERDYPLLAAGYLLAKNDRAQFKATLQEMLGEMRRPGSYLHHGPTIGFALSNVTNVRVYVDKEGQSYLDLITGEAIKIREGIVG